MKRYSLYPGCLILERMPHYEVATRKVLERLGIDVLDMPRVACCGSPILESFTDDWLYLAAYNLALADGGCILTLCGSCTVTLKRANLLLRDEGLRRKANARLSELGMHLQGRVEVVHLLEVLNENSEMLKSEIVRALPLNVAIQAPCQVFRPQEIAGSLKPSAMADLVALTGARVAHFDEECCGATLLMVDEGLALRAGRARLDMAVSDPEADLIVDCCGNCHFLLERMQSPARPKKRLPILFLPQLLGLAMGMRPEELAVGPKAARLILERLA